MGWSLYIKNNEEGIHLLKMIVSQPKGSFTGLVDSIEKASMFDSDSYMKQRKRTVRGAEKIFYTLMQAKKPSRPSRVIEPSYDYEKEYMMQAVSGEDDEEPVDTSKEDLMQKYKALQERRQVKVEPPKKPTVEEIKKERYGGDDDLIAEEDMDEYLRKSISKMKSDY